VDGATAQAEAVVKFCADKDPCNVVIMIGQLQFPFDNLRYQTYETVLAKHANIKVVATGEGSYSPDASLTAFQNICRPTRRSTPCCRMPTSTCWASRSR
jgi:ribose transport system substrate-binding protein